MLRINNIVNVEIGVKISATNKSKWQRHLDDSKSKYARDALLSVYVLFVTSTINRNNLLSGNINEFGV